MKMIGMFAVSKAGHDKGKMYVIIGQEDDILYLADGKIRGLEKPKKKKKKHLQIVSSELDPVIVGKLTQKQTIYNEEIKRAIKIRTNKEVTDVKG